MLHGFQHGNRREQERCTGAEDKKNDGGGKKVREETIFVPVPREIRRPTYLDKLFE